MRYAGRITVRRKQPWLTTAQAALMGVTTETFFRPAERARERVNIPAPIFNRCLLALNHASTRHVFIPIRSMQYQAIIDESEIIFVDNQGYAVSEGQGGRLIVLAWDVTLRSARDSLTAPVPIEIIYYNSDGHEIHRRLMSEFPKALDRYESRQKSDGCEDVSATVLPFRQA
jgi:hypothetical protein